MLATNAVFVITTLITQKENITENVNATMVSRVMRANSIVFLTVIAIPFILLVLVILYILAKLVRMTVVAPCATKNVRMEKPATSLWVIILPVHRILAGVIARKMTELPVNFMVPNVNLPVGTEVLLTSYIPRGEKRIN